VKIIHAEIRHGVAFLTAEDSDGFRNTKKVVASGVGFHFCVSNAFAFAAAEQAGTITVRGEPYDVRACGCGPCWESLHTERLTREEWERNRR
jgi:hypothetical protein